MPFSHIRNTNNSKRHGQKGLSTVIGMSIFLLIFAIAVTFTYTWTQNTAGYLNTAQNEFNYNVLKSNENLYINITDQTHISLINPTSNYILATQLWDNHHNYYSINMGMPGFTTSSPIPVINTTNSNFTVITSRGNVFSTVPKYSIFNTNNNYTISVNSAGRWNISLYAGTSTFYPILIPGNFTWDTLSFSLNFGPASVLTSSGAQLGINASTYINVTSSPIQIYNTFFAYVPNQANNTYIRFFINDTLYQSPPFYQGSIGRTWTVSLAPNQVYKLSMIYYADMNATNIFPHSITVMVSNAKFQPIYYP